MNHNEFFDLATFKEAPNSEDRNSVITKAVTVEKYVSLYLSYLLGINDYLESKSFGQTSSALSFNSKIVLFTDLGVLTSEEKEKFNLFGEIRNRFAHNEQCTTFDTAYTTQHLNKLKKFYGVSLNVNELFNQLYSDIKTILEKVKLEIYNTKALKTMFKHSTQIHNVLIAALRSDSKNFNQVQFDKIYKQAIDVIAEESDRLGPYRTDIRIDFDKAFS